MEEEDVSKELQSIIADMLEERCGDSESDEETVKEVLTESGDARGLYIYNMMINFNYFFLGCILFTLAIDLGTVAWKYYKANK